ncbi:MAG: hypothetical protein CSYNP_00790 [Syntrophus sp. SKADARSKE-3]|nr:hypothetical protein [Syntrophus sp. SKADARSKE-3]
MVKYLWLLIILLFALQNTVSAEYYKWEDENGNINITDYPPPTKSVKNIKIRQLESESADKNPATNETRQKETKTASSRNQDIKPSKSNEVILYTTSWCPYCKKAKEFFNNRNIYFTEYDIEKDREAAERKKQLDSRGGVPFAIINGQQIHGYSPNAYEKALQ